MTTPTQERIAQQIAEIEREMAGLRAEVGFMHSDLSELQAELRRRLASAGVAHFFLSFPAPSLSEATADLAWFAQEVAPLVSS